MEAYFLCVLRDNKVPADGLCSWQNFVVAELSFTMPRFRKALRIPGWDYSEHGK